MVARRALNSKETAFQKEVRKQPESQIKNSNQPRIDFEHGMRQVFLRTIWLHSTFQNLRVQRLYITSLSFEIYISDWNSQDGTWKRQEELSVLDTNSYGKSAV